MIATETTEAIEYARGILNRAGTPESPLAGLIDRYDRLLAEAEAGIFSWHQALYNVAQQAKQAAVELTGTLSPYDPIPDHMRGDGRNMALLTAEEHAAWHARGSS